MRPRIKAMVAACGAGLGCAASLSAGQSSLWLRVDGVGTPGVRPALVEIDAAGRSLEVEDWLGRASWVHGLSDFGSHNYTAVLGEPGVGAGDGGAAWAVLPPAELVLPGRVALFGVQMEDRIVTLSPEEFGVLAERAGVAWTPREGEDRIVVRRIEGAKVLLRTPGVPTADGEASGATAGIGAEAGGPIPSGVPTTKRGERAEIRPLMDPTTCTGGAPGGGVLPVRLYTEGEAVPGAVVIATHVESGAEQRVAARQFGIADLQIDREGAWRIEFTVLYPVPRDQEAAWVAYTGTLSFETAWSNEADGMDEADEKAGASGGGGGR